jgi:pimeloyl-ACP methyl ester carboxylesterase
LIQSLSNVLPATPAGERASWVFERLQAVAAGGTPPNEVEIAQQYAPSWLDEVPTGSTFFSELAPIVGATVMIHKERSRLNEARVVLELADGSFRRFRCAVEGAAPHRINFQIFSPAVAPAISADQVVRRDGRSVHVRDYGGDGPLLLLWHGSGCDATVWEGMVPYLGAFHVLAQDLPGHGASPLPRLSVTDAIADAEALHDELGLGDPILVGHSVGGWIALRYAAAHDRCRGLVCLDGPSALDDAAMALEPHHPGFVPDPPDVATELAALRCPTLITLCTGTSPAEAEWMVPFRQGLSDHIMRGIGPVRQEWLSTGHMMVLTHPKQTAELITQFVREQVT